MTYTRTIVTPEVAAEWLKRNENNYRPRSEFQVGVYAKLMRADLWHENGDAIRFDEEGNLIDGQTRLEACVESGVSFICMVVHNLPCEAASTIDMGRKRTMAHHLRHAGESNTSCLASAARWLHTWRSGKLTAKPGMHPQLQRFAAAAEAVAVIGRDPGIRKSVAWIKARPVLYRLISPSMASFLHYAFSLRNPLQADAFFEALDSGAGLQEGSAVWRLRRRLTGEEGDSGARRSAAFKRLPEMEQAALLIKAWNFHLAGKSPRRLGYRADAENPESFPEVPEYPPTATS